MADEVSRLIVRAESGELVDLRKELERIQKEGRPTERATDGLSRGFKNLAATVLSVSTAIATVRKLVSSGRTFDIMNAQLKTITGSQAAANEQFEILQEFAADTPEQLNDVIDAFARLSNLGLDPSEAALTSYGNTAAAMGRDLMQMVEAVADATTGEFERLKEFGIRASSEGDQVSFTFQGVTTTVQKSAEEIEGYLRGIGDINFAGAMAERAATLDGAISNLEDSWEALWINASRNGAGEEMENQVRELVNLLEDPATLEAVSALGSAIVSSMTAAGEAVAGTTNFIRSFAEGVAEIVHGPAAGDLVGLQEELADNYERLAVLNEVEIKNLGGLSAARQQEYNDLIRRNVEIKRLLDLQTQLQEEGLQPTEVAEQAVSPDSILQEIDPGGEKLEDKKLETLVARRERELAILRESFMTEEQLEADSYQKRLEQIRYFESEKLLAEDEARAMREQAEVEHSEKMKEIDLERQSAATEWFRDGLSIAEQYYSGLEGQEAAYARAAIRTISLLSDAKKRDALRNVIVKGYEGIQEAVASAPFPGNLVPVAYATGQFATNLAGVTGARAQGGQVRPGEPYLVGERGPEVLQMGNLGGSILTMEQIGAGRSSPPVVHNHYHSNTVNLNAIDTQSGFEFLMNNRGAVASAFNETREERGDDPL